VTASAPAARAGLVLVAGVLGLGAAAPPTDLRTDLETVGLALDRAVLQVSRPSRAAAVARGGARGYRLEGFGAMFVLPPRALPLPAPAPTAEEREIARKLAEAARDLEQRLPKVESPDLRLQLQQSLKALRQSEAEVRLRERMGSRAAGVPVAAEGAAPVPRTLEQQQTDLERDVQMMQRMQSEALESMTADLPPEVRQEIEDGFRSLNLQAEAFAAEAERALQEAQRGVQIRLLGPPLQPAVPPGVPLGASATPPTPEAAIPMPPSYPLWIEPMVDPTPDPQGVIAGVGEAVTLVLEQHGVRLRALQPQDMVAVAIDFVPATRPGVRARPARTLMVRARKADIDQRAAGLISPEEFRKRVERLEYLGSGGRGPRDEEP
jgi:hypothetical protein